MITEKNKELKTLSEKKAKVPIDTGNGIIEDVALHYDDVKQSINECLKNFCFELREHPSYTYDKIKNIFKEEFGELVQ